MVVFECFVIVVLNCEGDSEPEVVQDEALARIVEVELLDFRDRGIVLV